MNYEDILIKPVLSEEATALREQDKYTFIVVHPITLTLNKRVTASLICVFVASG